MSRTFGSIALAIFGALCLAGLRYYFHAQQQQKEMDAFVAAKLSQNLKVPLDCPPLGRQEVTFDVEDSNVDLTGTNLPRIMEQWPNIWRSVYDALAKNVADDKGKDHLGDKPEITVVLPSSEFADKTEWHMEYDCVMGYFDIDLTGLNVTSAHYAMGKSKPRDIAMRWP